MATGTKVSALNPDTTPTSDDLLLVVNDPLGTPGSKKATTANVIAKAHGLSDGMIEVAGGVMGVATAGTDYTSPSSTETFTNKTYDTAGTGNSLSINGVAATANTGTGAVVRDTSPTLVTPILGVAAATTVNKVALTAPATGSTLTIADGQTLTVNGSATITNGTHSGTNTGDQTIPSVATGTELDTGTDNDKIATALALKNSHNVPSVAPSTSGNLLQSNGTDWVSNTVAFAKPTYDAVVALSGGDYTTLGAALAAASAGWSIAVKPGTYTESSITSFALANITITGFDAESTIIDLGANNFTATSAATNLTIQGLKITCTTGGISFQGANTSLINCHIYKTGLTARLLYLSGADSSVRGCWLNSASTDTATTSFTFLGTNTIISDNTFTYNATYTSNAAIYFNGNYQLIKGNVFKRVSGSHEHIRVTGTGINFSGNNIYHTGSGDKPLALYAIVSCTVSGNNIQSGGADFGIYVTGTGNNTISSNTFLGTGITAIYLGAGTTTLTISGNTFSGYSKAINATGGLVGINITGNAMNACAVLTSTGTYWNISNNNWVMTGSIIALTLQGTYMSVTGNTFKGASGNNGIAFGAGNNTIVANNVFDTTMTSPLLYYDWTQVSNILSNNTGVSNVYVKDIVYCKNTSGSTIAAGSIVTLKAVAAGNEVTTTTTASDNLVFGVTDASIANNAYGYIQTRGKTTLLKVNGTTDIAVGDFITTYTTAGIGAKATAGMLGTTPGDLAIAIALEAYTANDSSGVVDALIIEPRRL